MNFANLIQSADRGFEQQKQAQQQSNKRARTQAVADPYFETIAQKLFEIQKCLRGSHDDQLLNSVEIEVIASISMRQS